MQIVIEAAAAPPPYRLYDRPEEEEEKEKQEAVRPSPLRCAAAAGAGQRAMHLFRHRKPEVSPWNRCLVQSDVMNGRIRREGPPESGVRRLRKRYRYTSSLHDRNSADSNGSSQKTAAAAGRVTPVDSDSEEWYMIFGAGTVIGQPAAQGTPSLPPSLHMT